MERPVRGTQARRQFRLSATFSNCEAATGGGPLHGRSGTTRTWPMTMASSSGTPLASVSALSNDGTQFTATWHNGT